MDNPDVKGVPSGQINVPGVQMNLTVLVDVHPSLFSDGLDVSLTRPGKLEMVGSCRIPKGALILYVPPELAIHFRGVMKPNPTGPNGRP